MAMTKMYYLMVLSAHCFPISESRFAIEGAFSDHLRRLRRTMIGRFDEIRLAAPIVDEATYAANPGNWKLIDAESDGIKLLPMHKANSKRREYWSWHLLPNIIKLNREIKEASVVHAGPSHPFRPFDFVAILLAVLRVKPTIYVVDIDQRNTPLMNLKAGRWSRKSYLLANYIYIPLLSFQTWFAVRFCSLVLLKSRKLVTDFGKDRQNVRNFIDAAFDSEYVISELELNRKIEALEEKNRPLRLVYFGRLVSYKGVDRSLEAVAKVVEQHGPVIRLLIIGAGAEEEELRQLALRLGISHLMEFRGPIPFGEELFSCLRQQDLLLATPMAEDTPRSALDAMASAVPVLAFDTYYYQDLQQSGAVEVVPWPSIDAFARRIAEIAGNKPELGTAMESAVRFAKLNTQEVWLQRRYRWTLEAMGKASLRQ